MDIPETSEDYIHRIGRTGRAGREGVSFSFVYGKEMRKMSVLPFIFSFFFYVQNRPKNCKIFHKNAYKTNIFCYNRRKSE